MTESRPEDDRDDDALSWAGEGGDPTLVAGHGPVGRKAPRAVRSAPREREARDGDVDELPDELREDDEDGLEDDEPDDERDAADAAAASSVLLVAMGVAAGLYLLWTIGWMITATRQNATIAATFAGDPLGGGLYGLGLWLAVAGPAAWFAAVLLGTRSARTRTRVLWLIAGLILLAPLPFLKGA
ncbi:DNA polymerase III subunit gamma/tau [Rathayibacter sp. VKM Ac-2835]|uniref:DNA polymerase III subunit gamma/tau n=1 Tax=Rathayibacter sp. VKM Ac-2835 TaxID=2739043 RepID=UPI001563F3A0|nr:DNA polymerase III subunit gamma/tau [Rathayibacter sp. VKM Ac-2835]NRG41827.1 DNA polymerase III subunit gamma/tau [Rathayibacter sp. VKM Ac-2835]